MFLREVLCASCPDLTKKNKHVNFGLNQIVLFCSKYNCYKWIIYVLPCVVVVHVFVHGTIDIIKGNLQEEGGEKGLRGQRF